MKTKAVIELASDRLQGLPNRSFDIFTLGKPIDLNEAVSMARLYKIISKVSPLVGNLIEFDTANFLNQFDEFKPHGK